MILPSILDFLAERIGLSATSVGLPSIEAALRDRMEARHIPDIGTYSAVLRAEPAEQEALIELVVVPETWFFRDQMPFQFLAVNAARRWGNGSPTAPIRILSLPCASGEEPYSIAMTLLDAGFKPDCFQIEAVDVSEKALQRARAAIYTKNDFRGRNLDVLQRHFIEDVPDVFQVVPRIRHTIRFSSGTLLQLPFPEGLTTFHAIFCRNLLIYLNPESRQHAVTLFKKLIRPDGILFIGHADATPALSTQFAMVRDASAFAYHPLPEVMPVVREPAAPPRTAPAPKAPAENTIESLAHQIETGQGARAMESIRAALLRNRDNPELYYLLGAAHALEGQPLQARDAWQKSLYLQPQHLKSLQRLKNLFETEGDHAAAARIEARIRRIHS